jgi:hypothetical protein
MKLFYEDRAGKFHFVWPTRRPELFPLRAVPKWIVLFGWKNAEQFLYVYLGWWVVRAEWNRIVTVISRSGSWYEAPLRATKNEWDGEYDRAWHDMFPDRG